MDNATKAPIEVELTAGETYYWCSCGKSDKQPFCNGAHQGSDKEPVEFIAENSEAHYLCGCKQNDGSPFCNGSHRAL